MDDSHQCGPNNKRSSSDKTKAPHYLYIRTHERSQHFWHFMMAEFLPVAHTILSSASSSGRHAMHVHLVKSRISFPLNSFYRELETIRKGLTITLSDTPVPGKTYHTPTAWDMHTNAEDTEHLLHVAAALREWAAHDHDNATKPTTTVSRSMSTHRRGRRGKRGTQIQSTPLLDCVVQDRVNTNALETYFRTTEHMPKRTTYGSTRRHVSNIVDVAERLKRDFASQLSVRTVSDDGRTLKEQIRTYLDASVLVLGHGAGMVHTLWMRPGSLVLEIIPEQKMACRDGAVQGLVRLTRMRRFAMERIVVRDAVGGVKYARVKHRICKLLGPHIASRRTPRHRATKRLSGRNRGATNNTTEVLTNKPAR